MKWDKVSKARVWHRSGARWTWAPFYGLPSLVPIMPASPPPPTVGPQSSTPLPKRVVFRSSQWHMSPQALTSPQNKKWSSPPPPSSLQALRSIPASPSCVHPRVSTGGFQANRYSRKPFSPHLPCPHKQKAPLNSTPPTFPGIQRPQKESAGPPVPVTCYLGQQANSNHVIAADKAAMRPAYYSK